MKDGYDRRGYDREGYDKKGYDRDGYDREGYAEDGYDIKGFNKEGFHRVTRAKYDEDGYDVGGYNIRGYNREGYDVNGFDVKGINKVTRDKFDENGYDKAGYDKKGYDKDGYDRDGYNEEGYDKRGKTKEDKKNIRRSIYLGLLSKTEKLANGQMSIEEYISTSKLTIEELIEFAKEQHMNPDIIRGLQRQKKAYKRYAKPFVKKNYLQSTILIINGKEVRPTEKDVDLCIEYLKVNEILICDKNVRDTVKKYLKGEIDISVGKKNDETTKTELEQLEEEQKGLIEKLEQIEKLGGQVTQVENQKNNNISIGD